MAKDHVGGKKRGLNIIIVGCKKFQFPLTNSYIRKDMILHWWTEVQIVFRH